MRAQPPTPISSHPPAVTPISAATVTLTRTVTAAVGVFAPGHLGELARYLPFELVDDVVQTRTVQQRLRMLPSRTGVVDTGSGSVVDGQRPASRGSHRGPASPLARRPYNL